MSKGTSGGKLGRVFVLMQMTCCIQGCFMIPQACIVLHKLSVVINPFLGNLPPKSEFYCAVMTLFLCLSKDFV